ncbi:unnamed protein product [Fraxinus pennsylvanica]|uniref:Uncharacterized protein n=1 Tax=Fraxinus pennsylvanica TaxID=56036 RepID=A0AAD2DUG4_9LAMI|nr:unnamed protein product [Fraxinus pennsylvanica]
MVNDFQKGSLSTRLGIPMIYGIDAVHGNNNVYNATIFPHNIGLGATRQVISNSIVSEEDYLFIFPSDILLVCNSCFKLILSTASGDTDHLRRIGDATAVEVRATGIPYAFAACIAVSNNPFRLQVCRDPRWGRCYESYSEDPKIVEEMTDIILGTRNKVAACAKHSVGDGETTKGIDENNTVIDMQGLLRIHMPAYYDSMDKGVATVMISYSSGMIMIPYNFTEFIQDLTYLVKKNFIPMKRIDDAVGRILLVKFTLGLFENPLADLSLINEVGSQAHRNLAREADRKSLVLLKNGKNGNDSVLPLPKKVSRILVAGTTILSAINSTVHKNTEVIYSENPDSEYVKSQNFNYAVVVVGEHPYSDTKGDSKTLTIADPRPDVIKNVCGVVKCVVIIISGQPIVIAPYISGIDALVAAWLPGSEGQGVTDVLFGDYGFNGKLPRTWFKTVDQLPMNIGDSHYDPLSSIFGHLVDCTSEARLGNVLEKAPSFGTEIGMLACRGKGMPVALLASAYCSSITLQEASQLESDTIGFC